MRTESMSSIKSDMISESESYYDSYIQIKKEVPNYIIIEKKIYEKIIQHLKNSNSFKEQIKIKYNKKNCKKLINYQKSIIDEFSIISTNKNKKEDKLISENKNNNNDNKNVNNNINTPNNNNSNINEGNTQNNDIKTNIDMNKNMNNNSNKKVNPNTSMMSLFMNMNSQKEKSKEKEEISKLKLIISEMTKKHEAEIDNYKVIIKEFSNKIESLQKELKKLNKKEKSKKQKIQIIFSHPKLLTKIISYLENDEKFNLSKVNSGLYKNVYFKTVTEKLYKKMQEREKILENFRKEDINSIFDIKDNEIIELYKNYIIEQKVSGKEMRNDIVKSLVFLETNVKIPMNNFKGGVTQNENNFDIKGPKKEKFFTKFFSAIKSEIKEEIENYKNENLLNNNYISFSQNDFNNLNDTKVLETFKTDKSLNIKFEYNNPNKIKDIINEFFLCQLPQPNYQNFIQKICETFCDLLYSSFLALNDIKNLQIITFSLYGKYIKLKLKNEELISVIEDLNHFADSNRQIKEMLTKSKNELEFKYTNSMMTISQLNNIIIEKEKEINNINTKAKEKEENYEQLKSEIINKYQKIKNDFNFTKNERDSLKGVLIELKDYFIRVVTGELLN